MLGAAAGLSAGLLSPMVVLFVISGTYFTWVAEVLKYRWLQVVLLLIFLSRFLVGGWMHYHMRRSDPVEAERRKVQEAQKAVAAIIAGVQERLGRPKPHPSNLGSHAGRLPEFEMISAGAFMTEARRLARNIVKGKLKSRGIRVAYVEAKEITEAANALIKADPSIVETAKANLKERNKVKVAQRDGEAT